MQKNKTINWGIIGPGKIAHKFAQGISCVKNAKIRAVASRSLERGNAFANTYRIENVYPSYQELCEDNAIDAIYIATPHRYHFQQVKQCLLAGKSVLCEKPIAINADHAERLFQLARQQKLFLMEGLWTVMLPIYQTVAGWLDETLIGSITAMESEFGFKAPFDANDRVFNKALAGGALLDIGLYNVAISHWVMGTTPASVSASAQIGVTGVDESVSAALSFAGGITSEFNISIISPLDNTFLIRGTTGSITINKNFWRATSATLERESDGKTVRTEIIQDFESSGFEYEIQHATDCIINGMTESPLVSPQDSINTLKTLDKIRELINLKYDFE